MLTEEGLTCQPRETAQMRVAEPGVPSVWPLTLQSPRQSSPHRWVTRHANEGPQQPRAHTCESPRGAVHACPATCGPAAPPGALSSSVP